MKRIGSTVTVLLVPLLFAGCGGDDKDGSAEDDSPSETLPADEAAVRDALVASFFDPSCELLTEDYLLDKALLSATAEDACTEHMQAWVEPQYEEDDVLVSDIAINGDVATAVVGSDIADITTTYQLTLVDGDWLVSCDDFNCSDLAPSPPSAEVS